MYEWQGVGLIVLAGVDLSPPDGAAMQMSTCPLCSLLAPARDGVHKFCSNWGFTISSLLTPARGEAPRKELELLLKLAVHNESCPLKIPLPEYTFFWNISFSSTWDNSSLKHKIEKEF